MTKKEATKTIQSTLDEILVSIEKLEMDQLNVEEAFAEYASALSKIKAAQESLSSLEQKVQVLATEDDQARTAQSE
ncbi:MAG: exodeoxyribonuclease VII small subunit [Pseudomonadales bacterium]|nr:exodeoxyribonuclease VII small subunit [Pseudomonadales bacterium]